MNENNRVMDEEKSVYERMREPLDYQQLLFRQIERINSMGTQDMVNSVYTLNGFSSGIQCLHALLTPLVDEEFLADMQKLDKQFSDIKKKQGYLNDEQHLEYWHKYYIANLKLMSRKGLLMAFGETEEIK